MIRVSSIVGLVLVLGWANISYAEEKIPFTISYSPLTFHPSSEGWTDEQGVDHKWNEDNQVVGIHYNLDETSGFGVAWAMNGNSYGEDSYVIEYDKHIHAESHVDLGANLFLASGYEEMMGEDFPWLPGVAPYIRFKDNPQETFSIKITSMNFMAHLVFVEYRF